MKYTTERKESPANKKKKIYIQTLTCIFVYPFVGGPNFGRQFLLTLPRGHKILKEGLPFPRQVRLLPTEHHIYLKPPGKIAQIGTVDKKPIGVPTPIVGIRAPPRKLARPACQIIEAIHTGRNPKRINIPEKV